VELAKIVRVIKILTVIRLCIKRRWIDGKNNFRSSTKKKNHKDSRVYNLFQSKIKH
jgi:hypothetical protein